MIALERRGQCFLDKLQHHSIAEHNKANVTSPKSYGWDRVHENFGPLASRPIDGVAHIVNLIGKMVELYTRVDPWRQCIGTRKILQQLDARAWAAKKTASDPLQRVDKQLTFHLIPKRFEHATFALNGCCRAANVVKLISLRQNRRLNHG